jgi:hypothetical protein
MRRMRRIEDPLWQGRLVEVGMMAEGDLC